MKKKDMQIIIKAFRREVEHLFINKDLTDFATNQEYLIMDDYIKTMQDHLNHSEWNGIIYCIRGLFERIGEYKTKRK